MTKITPEHLLCPAYVYVRQSTPEQLVHNTESRHRQYALKHRAESLGWQDVRVIDDDLGRSGSGVVRLGFERLLVEIGRGNAGAVLAIEASRLARNGRDWHTLLELCGLVGCLLIDEDGIYDPRLVNDRLLLGMKGTFSELELSMFRQRSQEAIRAKASRGELHTSVAIGYVRASNERLERDPDRRVCQAIEMVFRKFDEARSVRQVAVWLRQENIRLPTRAHGPQGCRVDWQLPHYSMVHRILTNPVYAGAYVFGRTVSRATVQAGRTAVKRGVRRCREEWSVLIRDHHAGYISWEQYERNQRRIRENANMKGAMVRGSIRQGNGLLAGLLRCGHCGRKLKIEYSNRQCSARYSCSGAMVNHALPQRCIAFGGARVDAAVANEVLRVISPVALTAALAAVAEHNQVGTERISQVELGLEQARFEASRAARQYDAVDPENRIVASELERRWNERLADVARLEEELRIERQARPAAALSDDERASLMALAEDLPRAWNHPAAAVELRKQILRAALEEIVVRVDDGKIGFKLHWKGGQHTALEVAKNRSGEHRWKTSVETEQLVRQLARLLPDAKIAGQLNRLGIRSAKGHTWTELRICNFRGQQKIPIYREHERAERGELLLQEAVTQLGVGKMTVIRLIKDNVLPARQICPGGPYVIQQHDLGLPAVRRAIANGRAVSPDPRQKSLLDQ